MNVKIKLDGGIMPKKATPFDAAYDVYVPEDFTVRSGRQVLPLAFSMDMPVGLAALMRARSGYSLKGVEAIGVTFNGAEEKLRLDADVITGLVDCQYRNTVGVLLNVHHIEAYYRRVYIKKGTRIAQMQFVQAPPTALEEVDHLDMTNDRGGGFGHTNK